MASDVWCKARKHELELRTIANAATKEAEAEGKQED